MTDAASGNKLSLKPDYWRYFAGEAAKGGDCPLYEHLSLAVAEDEAMQRLTLPARPGQPPANMLFAAVHYALLAGADHALRLHYSHLLKPGEAEASIDAQTYAVFKDFVAAHRDIIDPLIANRVTNTNEVRRTSYLRPGYAEIAGRALCPLHILELGPSAGLNLNWDRYGIRYADESGGRLLEGGPASDLVIDATWRGQYPPPVPHDPPAVAARLGLEMNPVDLSSEADRRWLMALLWPGRPERIERMLKALQISARRPPPIRAGDALESLPAELANIAPEHAAVVTHSLVTYQWNEPMWARLDAVLAEASRVRPVFRLFSDRIARDDQIDFYPLRLFTYENGAARREILANVHHHGTWIEWLA